jgi:hypothetical protein
MKKHGNTHKAPKSSKRQSSGNPQAVNSNKINIGSADDTGVHDNDRDSSSPPLMGGSSGSGNRQPPRGDRTS